MNNESIKSLEPGDFIFDKRECLKYEVKENLSERGLITITGNKHTDKTCFTYEELLCPLYVIPNNDLSSLIYTNDDALYEIKEWLGSEEVCGDISFAVEYCDEVIGSFLEKAYNNPVYLYKNANKD